jgi:hypothetical protein
MSEFTLTGLNGREYKMMLAPKDVRDEPKEAADWVWSKLSKAFGPHLSNRATFPELPKAREREIEFRDTGELALDNVGYSLRLRTDDKSEVTLKLRTADIFVSGSTSLPKAAKTDGEENDAKFEEDVAPLEVQGDGITLPDEPGIRSRFSRSTGREKKGTYSLERYSDAKTLFTTLDASLEELGVTLTDDTALNPGPAIDEYVFKAKGISLKNDVEIGVAVTLWYLDEENPAAKKKPLRVVELSFQWDFPKVEETDEDPEKTFRTQARRAEGLFIDMQRTFWDQIDRENSSKTKLGLPKPK